MNLNNNIIALFAILFLSEVSFSKDLSDSLMPLLVVKDTSIDFSVTNKDCEGAFFVKMANTNYNRMYGNIKTNNWYQKWANYYHELLRKANAIGKDTNELNNLFKGIKPINNDSLGQLPIALYFIKQRKWLENKDYIIILIGWGYIVGDGCFGHIKGYIFEMKSKKMVCSMTCR